MVRLIGIMVLSGLCAAAAPVTPPSTAPSRRPVASQPSVTSLQARAYDLMRQGEFTKARIPLDKAYNATPPAARSRALVLNHAILDMLQKTFVMRGVKDLNAYLTKNRDEDEYATNVFGGALNIAAADPLVKRGDLWQSAFREWDRRNFLLDHSRAGQRRWGTRWISDDELAAIKAQQEGLRQSIEDQQERVNRASDRAASLLLQQQNALDSRTRYDQMRYYLQTYATTPQTPTLDSLFAQNNANQAINGFWEADQTFRRLGAEAEAAIREYETEARRLVALRQKVIRPDWPTKFDPIDPESPEASKPPRMATTTTALVGSHSLRRD